MRSHRPLPSTEVSGFGRHGRPTWDMSRLISTIIAISGRDNIPGIANILAIAAEFPFALQDLRTVPLSFTQVFDDFVANLASGTTLPTEPSFALKPVQQLEEVLLMRFWMTARDPDDRPGSWIILARAAGLTKYHDLDPQFGEDWRTPLDAISESMRVLALPQADKLQRRLTRKVRHRVPLAELPE